MHFSSSFFSSLAKGVRRSLFSRSRSVTSSAELRKRKGESQQSMEHTAKKTKGEISNTPVLLEFV